MRKTVTALCLLLAAALLSTLPAVCAAQPKPLEPALYGNCRMENGGYLPAQGQSERTFSEGLCAVCIDGLWGYIDTRGDLVIDAVYDTADAFSQGLAQVTKDGTRLFIDSTGQTVFEAGAWDEATAACDGVIRVRSGALWGLIDTEGQLIAEPAWDSIGEPSEYQMVVSRDGLRGYINLKGKEVQSPQYTHAEPFRDGTAYVRRDAEGLLIDVEGSVLVENAASGLCEGLVLITQDGLWGFADETGETVIPCTFQDAEPADEGMIRVSVEGLWGFADLSGAVVIEPAWGYVWPFSGDCALYAAFDEYGVEVTGYGYLDRLGAEVTGPVFEEARSFSGGLAAVCDGGVWGYIGTDGTYAIEPAYDYAGDFCDGFAVTAKDGRYTLIDQTGTPLTVWRAGERPAPAEQPQQPAEPEEEPAPALNVAALAVLVITLAMILFIAGVSMLRSINIRRRRRARREKKLQFMIDEESEHDRY